MTKIRWRQWLAKSWVLSWCYYRLRGVPLTGRPTDEVWYFAYGSNMKESIFRERRGMCPLESRAGRIKGYRLRFNLEGRPKGKAAPANISPDPDAEVWGVLYKITRAGLLHLDSTEGVPGRRYRPIWLQAEDINGDPLTAVTYIAQGKETDGNPSLRYLTFLREGARAHGLPYVVFFNSPRFRSRCTWNMDRSHVRMWVTSGRQLTARLGTLTARLCAPLDDIAFHILALCCADVTQIRTEVACSSRLRKPTTEHADTEDTTVGARPAKLDTVRHSARALIRAPSRTLLAQPETI